MMKMIGVTPALSDQPGRLIINEDYMQAVSRAGALPVLLPLTDDEKQWEEMLRRIDGLLLSGGSDVGPEYYGEETQPYCGETAPRRDKQEFYLCKRALEMDLPILAICRGHQVLNCTLEGGALYQDIATQYNEELKHPRYEVPRDQVHEVKVEKGTKLHQITGFETLKVNSRHHQAVKTVGKGAVISARATDGLIEGIELPDKKFVVSIQWHPESLSDYAPDAQALFNAFVNACGGEE